MTSTSRRGTGFAARVGRLALLLFFCLAGAARASAQYSQSTTLTDRQTPAAFAPGVPSETIDNVDLFTGRVSVNFPLISFGGRGDVGYTPFVSINRTYNIHSVKTWSAPGQYSGQWSDPYYTLTTEGMNEYLSYGDVKAGLKPGVIVARKMRDSNPPPVPAPPSRATP